MGFRFRKTFKVGPLRTTLNKSGVSSSIGFKGFRYTLRADGKRQKTLSVPGTGLSFVEISKSTDSTTSDTEQTFKNAPRQANGINLLALIFLLVFVAVILLLMSLALR